MRRWFGERAGTAAAATAAESNKNCCGTASTTRARAAGNATIETRARHHKKAYVYTAKDLKMSQGLGQVFGSNWERD